MTTRDVMFGAHVSPGEDIKVDVEAHVSPGEDFRVNVAWKKPRWALVQE